MPHASCKLTGVYSVNSFKVIDWKGIFLKQHCSIKEYFNGKKYVQLKTFLIIYIAKIYNLRKIMEMSIP